MKRFGLAVFAAALALAAAFLGDRPAYEFLHEHFHEKLRPVPPALRLPTRAMEAFEKCGESLFGILIGAVLWQVSPRRRGTVACLLAASMLTMALSETVKRCTGRLRPDVAAGRTVFHGLEHRWDTHADGHSFPSGHTAAAAAYGGVVASAVPPLRGLAILATCGVGTSRMWKERHFLSDVVAGALLGGLVGAGLSRNTRCRRCWAWCDRRLAPRRAAS